MYPDFSDIHYARISGSNCYISVILGQPTKPISYPAHISGFFGYTYSTDRNIRSPDIWLQLLCFSHSGTADEANILPGPCIRSHLRYRAQDPDSDERSVADPFHFDTAPIRTKTYENFFNFDNFFFLSTQKTIHYYINIENINSNEKILNSFFM